MIQGNYVRAAIAKLHKAQTADGEYPTTEVVEALKQIVLWVDMVERRMEQVEIEARRPRFFR